MKINGALTKQQLAKMYNVSIKTLNKWIRENQALYDSLLFLGYQESNKILTPEQVKTIFKYLGEPTINLNNYD